MTRHELRAGVLSLLLVLSVVSIAFGGTALASHGDTIIVDDDGGEDFETIQAAVDHANDGDTIEVRAGTYDSVDLDKNVSLVGDGPGSTVIEGGDDNAILLTGHTDELGDIVVSGFTLHSAEAAGLIAFSDGNTDFDTRNLLVSNVVVDGAVSGIYFFDATGVTIQDSEVRNVEGAAIAMAGVENVRIEGNELADNGAGVSVGIGFPASVYPDNADIRVVDNNIDGNDVGVFNDDETLTVDATENYWGHASGPGGEDGRTNPAGQVVGKGDAIEGDVTFDPWLRRPA